LAPSPAKVNTPGKKFKKGNKVILNNEVDSDIEESFESLRNEEEELEKAE